MSEQHDWRTPPGLGSGPDNEGGADSDDGASDDGRAGSGGAAGDAVTGDAGGVDQPDGAESAAADGSASAAQRDQAGNVWSGRAVGPLSRLLPGGTVDPLVGDVPAEVAGGNREPVALVPVGDREFALPGSLSASGSPPATPSADDQPDDAPHTAEPDAPANAAVIAESPASAESAAAAESRGTAELTGGAVGPGGAAESRGAVRSAGAAEPTESAQIPDVADASAPLEASVPEADLTEADLTSSENRWRGVLIGFVDDPRGSVEAASALIDEDIAQHIAQLAQHKEAMHATWRSSDDNDTEALRVSLVDYRDLRNRLADVAAVLRR